MRISKPAHKRLSIFLAVVMIVTMLAPMASAATGVSAVTLAASTTTPSVGGSVTLTATATASSLANVQYEFWLYDANGNWVCAAPYSASNTYTLTDIKAGMQIAAVYAKDGDNAVMSNRVYLNVGTTSSVTTTYADGKITAVATTTNIAFPRYDWWYKDPSGVWVSHYQHFTENSSMTLENPAPGTYEIVCNVTDREFFWSLSENDGQWGSALFSQAAPPAVSAGLAVDSVSAITKTSVTVVLAADTDATKAADKANYTVKIGEEAIAVTNVSYAEANKTAVLTVALDTKAGIVSVNNKAAATAVDYQKPTITNVQAINNKTIVVTFSEPVDGTAGANSAIGTFASTDAVKYSLYNKTNGTSVRLTSDAPGSNDTVTVTAIFANTEKNQVKFNIVSVGSAVTGFPNSGLANGGYIFYASNVNDKATVANTIVAGSPYEFNGTLTPDATAPALLSSTFNSASGAVSLTFDKPTTGAAPADDKVYFKVGTTTVLLKATDYDGAGTSTAIAGTGTVTFTVENATLTAINALGANPQIVLAAAAFTDGTNAIVETTSTPTISTGPVLNSVAYDENTNTAVFKFSKTINVAAITTFVAKFNIGGLDIYGGAPDGATFQTTSNSTDLQFKLSDANAQLVEAAVRAGTLTASVVAGTVNDTETTPNANIGATSNATLVVGATYIKDTTAPTLSSAKYNGDSKVLELTFNEPVRNTVADYTLGSIEFYKDDNGVAGLQTAVVNGVAADTKIATFADCDLSAAVNNHGILAGSFRKDAADSDAVAATTVEAATLFIKDKDGGVEELQDTLDTAIALPKDVYVNILVGGVKDANTNATTAVQSAKIAVNAVSNTTAITAATAVANVSLGEITVTFANASGSVAMDPTLATNPANYDLYLIANPLNKVAIKNIVMETNNTVARIFLSSPITASATVGDYAVKTSGLKTATGVVANIDGTTVAAEAWTAAANATALSATQSLVLTDVNASGTVNAGDTVKLIFSEAAKLPTGFAISDITVDNAHTLGNSTFALATDNKTLTITLGSTSTLAVGDKLTFPVTIKDFENVALAVGAVQTSNAMTVSGNVAPTMLSAVYTDTNADGVISTGDALVVKFNQPLSIVTGKTATDLINDITVGTTTFSAAALSGDTLTLTVNVVGTLAIGDTPVTNVAGPGTVDLQNSWGTLAEDAVGKAITKSDAVAPTVTAISYKASTNALTFTFSEAVNDATKTNANALAAALAADLTPNGGTLGAAFTAATLSADKKSVTITLDGDEGLDQYATITIAAGTFGNATDNIQDASGNIAVRGQGTPYTLTIAQ